MAEPLGASPTAAQPPMAALQQPVPPPMAALQQPAPKPAPPLDNAKARYRRNGLASQLRALKVARSAERKKLWRPSLNFQLYYNMRIQLFTYITHRRLSNLLASLRRLRPDAAPRSRRRGRGRRADAGSGSRSPPPGPRGVPPRLPLSCRPRPGVNAGGSRAAGPRTPEARSARLARGHARSGPTAARFRIRFRDPTGGVPSARDASRDSRGEAGRDSSGTSKAYTPT